MSKGVVVKNAIETMQIKGQPADFVRCIGDDRSDEDMFEGIATSVANRVLPATAAVLACTVNQKPSMAKYYLDNTFEVIEMLHSLSAAASAPNPESARKVMDKKQVLEAEFVCFKFYPLNCA